ncbi:cysteine synthase A [Pseudomonas aeruginosa]|nr:cysteine synthase A [Pseudomonas aeruginosa]
MPQQFDNPANPAIHEKTTGPEIWNDTEGAVDVLVSGGRHRRHPHRRLALHQEHPGKPILAVAVEPVTSPVISQALAGEEVKPAPHKIQGIGAGFVPKNLDLSLVDRVEKIGDDEAKNMALRLMQEEGILCGISSGAAMAAAVRLAEEPNMQGQDHRGDPPRFRRALSFEHALRRPVQRTGTDPVTTDPRRRSEPAPPCARRIESCWKPRSS